MTAYGVYRGHQGVPPALGTATTPRRASTSRCRGSATSGYYLCEDLATEGRATDASPTSTRRACRARRRRVRRRRRRRPTRSTTSTPTSSLRVRWAPSSTTRRSHGFKFEIVAGAANNQLARTAKHGPALREQRHPLRPGLRDQRGRAHQRVRRAPRVDARAQQAEGRARSTRRCCRIFELAKAEGTSPRAWPPTESPRSASSEARHLQRTLRLSTDGRTLMDRWPIPRSSTPSAPRKPAAGRGPGADRVRELRVPGRARGHGHGAHEQVRRGATRQAVLRRLRVRRRRRGPGPRSGQRSSSTPSTPTCSRTPGRRPTWRRTSRSWSRVTRFWGWT